MSSCNLFIYVKSLSFLVLFSSNPQIRCWSEGVTRWNPHDPTEAYTPGDGILPSAVSLCLFFHLHKGACNVLNSHLNGISWTQHTMPNSITSVPKVYKLQKIIWCIYTQQIRLLLSVLLTMFLFLQMQILTVRQHVKSLLLKTSLEFVGFGYINHNKLTSAFMQAVVTLIVHCWVELKLSICTTTKTS